MLVAIFSSIMSVMKRSYVQHLHFGHVHNLCIFNTTLKLGITNFVTCGCYNGQDDLEASLVDRDVCGVECAPI